MVLFSLEELLELSQSLFGLLDAGHSRLESALGLLRVRRDLVLAEVGDLVGFTDLGQLEGHHVEVVGQHLQLVSEEEQQCLNFDNSGTITNDGIQFYRLQIKKINAFL